MGIDDALLNTKSAVTEENIIEMNNGCICCSRAGRSHRGAQEAAQADLGEGPGIATSFHYIIL